MSTREWEEVVNAIKNKQSIETIVKLQRDYWNHSGISYIGHHSPEKVKALIGGAFGEMLVANTRILDFACGVGRFFEALKEYPTTYIGVDISSIYLTEARNRHPNILVFLIENKLPFSDEYFDFALSISLHTHTSLEQDKEIIGEIKRVLKPGGIFACSFFDKEIVPKCAPKPDTEQEYWFMGNWIIKKRKDFMNNFEGFSLIKELEFREDTEDDSLQTVLVLKKEEQK